MDGEPKGGAGLSSAEARRRAASGQANVIAAAAGRSLADILKANLMTRFNALLGSLLVVILVVGPIQDAVFGVILIANTLIGIAQEVRAKITLDQLAVLNAPRAHVVRDGDKREVGVREVVLGDLLVLQAGDEIVVDGLIESETGVEVNEALLSGESDPVTKRVGDEVLAGSFVSAGSGRYLATRVGESCYARRLTEEARRFQLLRSDLMRGINQILRLVTWVIVPVSILLVASQLAASQALPDAVRGSVAGVITLVPEGLVLLTSASLALAIVRLGHRRVLVQQLPAVEMLARADVLCIDKTGTLTDSEITLERVDPVEPAGPWEGALGALVHVDPHPNAAARAIGLAYPAPADWMARSSVPFSSDRKWSSATFDDRGSWVLGAPDVLLANRPEHGPLAGRAADLAAGGRRVLLLGRSSAAPSAGRWPALEPAALVLLRESIKPDAAATLADLAAQGLAIKLISGDHPATVLSVAARVGLEVDGHVVDGQALPPPGPELERIAEEAAAFGRVSPDQKRQLVLALQASGHTVAMLGDGVNDVLALKVADLGIAMGGGCAAARGVAAVVLLDDSFGGLPHVLQEGRRVIGNVERLASLFLTKTVYALVIAVAVGMVALPFPFLPRQLTLISAFTIGIPAVFLTLAPGFARVEQGFLGRVLRFSIPSGLVAGAATFAGYVLAVAEPNVTVSEERTLATMVMGAIGLWVLYRLARPLTTARRLLLLTMAGGLAAAVVLPPLRSLFDLDLPRPLVSLAAVGVITLALLTLEFGDRVGRIVMRAGP